MFRCRSDTKATTSNNSTYHVLSNKKPRYRNKISNPLPVISLLSNGVECIIYSVTLLMFSNHLFIWSVFVPKLLYLISQTVMHLILNIIYLFI